MTGISGFGNYNNLNLRTGLNSNQGKKVEENDAKTSQTESKNADTVASRATLEQVKFDQIDSLLIGKGIKINKPGQPQKPDDNQRIEQKLVLPNFRSKKEFFEYMKNDPWYRFEEGDKVRINDKVYWYINGKLIKDKDNK